VTGGQNQAAPKPSKGGCTLAPSQTNDGGPPPGWLLVALGALGWRRRRTT
jgi:hypothetical protein